MKTISKELLLANCRVESKKAGGSGTVIYSRPNEKGTHSTYLLTNEHVVDDNIEVKRKWSSMLKKDVKMDVLGTVEVHFFKYQYQSRMIGATAIQADIMAYDKDEDIALLKLRDEDKAPSEATLYPKDKVPELGLGMSVIAIGAALGEPPIMTVGRLSQFGREIENREYWISTAPTIFGNSGGAVYLEETGEFIGIPARIAVTLMGFSHDAITHLSYIVPITRIYKFLDDQLFRFLYDANFTEKGETEERERRRREEERKLAARDEQGEEAEDE